MTKTPTGSVDGIDIARLHDGHCYDVPAPLAEYLIVQGWAHVELRGRDRDESADGHFSGFSVQP